MLGSLPLPVLCAGRVDVSDGFAQGPWIGPQEWLAPPLVDQREIRVMGVLCPIRCECMELAALFKDRMTCARTMGTTAC